MKLEIGNRVGWHSAAGYLEGEIAKITLDLNKAGQIVPWINIKYDGRIGPLMCATDEYLKQMKVTLLPDETPEPVDEPFDKRHGGPWDRGSADSWYSRPLNPHYYKGGTGTSELVNKSDMTQNEIDAYYAGFFWNEKHGGKKEY